EPPPQRSRQAAAQAAVGATLASPFRTVSATPRARQASPLQLGRRGPALLLALRERDTGGLGVAGAAQGDDGDVVAGGRPFGVAAGAEPLDHLVGVGGAGQQARQVLEVLLDV